MAKNGTARVVRRNFPGPAGSSSPLRVHFSRRSYADVTGHARESVDAEVGGVLVGEIGEDAQGQFVDVRAIIRATAAREARAHITFTHETWTAIHTALDRDYPDFQIVGWYHTHPGFGVEFSAMDRFIQENFFSGKTQIAFLTDPLGGETAICFNGPNGVEAMSKFWVDGREHTAKVPPSHGTNADATAAPSGGDDLRRDVERLEGRVNHLIQALDEQRANFHRMLTAILVVACTAIIGWVAYAVWSDRVERLQPPRVQSYVPLPVRIGGETVMLGVAVVDWKVPPRLDALIQKVAELERAEHLKQQEEQRKLQQERKKK